MNRLDSVLIDLNRRYDKGTMLVSTYLSAMNKISAIQAAENEHEKQVAEFEMQRPLPEPRRTIVTFTERDGLRIEKPHSEQFTIKQRFWLAVTLRICVIGLVGLFALMIMKG